MYRVILCAVFAVLTFGMPAAPLFADDLDVCKSPTEDKLAGCALVYNNLCGTYYNKGEFDRAIAACDRAIKLNPKVAVFYNNRCTAYSGKGQYDHAIADCGQAIRLEPTAAVFYNNRCTAYTSKGDYDRAVADCSRAIDRDPKAAVFYSNRGNANLKKGDYERAISDFDQALKRDPKLTAAGQGREAAQAALEARTNLATPQTAPLPERRVALVIGNSAYRNVPALANPRRDAETVAEVLRQTGFETVIATDLDHIGTVKALRAFRTQADRADWALVYFAGHGIEIDRVNYLVPIDAKLVDDRDVTTEAVSYEELLKTVGGARALRLVVLDACRNNPFKDRMHRSIAMRSATDRGLAPPPEPEAGTLIAYSAKDGQVAADDVDGVNSPFARAFVAEIRKPGLEVRRLFDFVRDDVMEATGRRQQPYTYQSLGRPEYYFVAGK
jgi:tetratricopeptide (TPR) repeat protein